MEYRVLSESGLGRTSNLVLHNKSVETPINWYALSNIESIEFHTKAFAKSSVNSFLCNTYDLKFNDKKNQRRDMVRKFKDFGLNSKCDSGGYQAMSKGVEMTQDEVADFQIELNCDLNIQLDFPLIPNLTQKQIKKRIDYNTKNLEILVNNYNTTANFLPTIHGHNTENLEYSINGITKVLGKEPKFVAIGSLVPLSLNSNLVNKRKIVDIILFVRKKLPNTFIHILGMGGSMNYVGVFCGADSFDSAGWAQKSGYGVVQLPGVSDRYIDKHPNGRRALNSSELIQFLDCECPACKSYIDTFLDYKGRGEQKRLLRAIHNLHLFQSEMLKIRRAIRNDILENFIRHRLKNSRWLSLIDYAKNKVNKSEGFTIDNFI